MTRCLRHSTLRKGRVVWPWDCGEIEVISIDHDTGVKYAVHCITREGIGAHVSNILFVEYKFSNVLVIVKIF